MASRKQKCERFWTQPNTILLSTQVLHDSHIFDDLQKKVTVQALWGL